ncbi:MAG: Hint domain-containing protein [Pseudomonadota bacterium]|nr:Hint domain-containing protein [Pseudomonadota bacterium]
MAVVYVYSADDFIGGLPQEQGAAAAGTGPFELTLKDGATPTAVEIRDDDGVFDEVDYNQTIAGDVELNSETFTAGTSIHTAYDLVDTGSGHQVTSIHLGGNGYQQGAVDGLVSTEPLKPGETYSFNVERTSHRQDNQYDEFVACFAEDTAIATDTGPVAVQDLKPGDLVTTIEGTTQPVRLVLNRQLTADDLSANPKLRPIRISAGALGQGLPTNDLIVSPQHRQLVSGPLCERMFGESEVLVSARKLTQLPGIFVDDRADGVTYFHIVFDDHQVIFAEGAPTESFYFGEEAIKGMTAKARAELLALFPELDQATPSAPRSARKLLEDRAQRQLVQRLGKNDKSALVG